MTTAPRDVTPAVVANDATSKLAFEVRDFRHRVIQQLTRVVVGVDEVIDQLLVALLAGGHVLLEGVPGVAKTTLSKAFARVLGGRYQRIQFTPDLLPSDVTGTYVFDRKNSEFILRPGPIVTQVLLADEINRAPAKTQSALLEAMQEGQVTIEGTTLVLPKPFMVLATQNPVEQEGVYRLPEAQLDRFLVRIDMGYPGHGFEVAMLKLHSLPTIDPDGVTTPERVLEIQAGLSGVFGEDSLFEYIVALADASRAHRDIILGASPRAALSLLRCARARALLDGRHYFTHEDVQRLAVPVLGHRLILRPEAELDGTRVSNVIDEIIAKVPVMASCNPTPK